jgi:iron complex outermembrane receptor protein
MMAIFGRLSAGVSLIPLFAISLATPAAAQNAPAAAPAGPPATATANNNQPADEQNEEIVVTGSSLRGVAPVGSNLTTVTRSDLEEIAPQTVQQVLRTVPAIVGQNSAGQGSYGSFDGSGTNAPTIHGLGASASNSTLILINGHRLPLSGVNHNLADPNILPPLGLERVEVLADGASSVYGSDAVAGVVNFITRRNVNGIEATAQAGFGDSYRTVNLGVLAGKTWDTGSVLVAYNFSHRDNLNAGDRPFTVADHRAQGGTNFANFACSPAAITFGGLVYYSPYAAGSGVANSATANGRCDFHDRWDLIPSERRHNLLVSGRQEIGDRLTVTADFIYSLRENRQNISRGSASGTIFGPGSADPTRINPFFRAPAGSGATSETVTFDADDLLGPGAHIIGSAETYYGRLDADYRLGNSWRINVGTVIGRDRAVLDTVGQLCGSCFNLALNGLTSATLNGQVTTVTQTLTPANAIDVFGNGGTSAVTLARLADSRSLTVGLQSLTNFYGKIDGNLFELPGGTVRVAIGGEYNHYTLKQDVTRPNNLGPASTNSAFLHLDYDRNVKSGYVELYVPLLSPEQGIPGIRRLELIASGRIDDYSDFGSTTNPKIAANWEVFDGFRVRGNWARSFVAPALASRGSNAFGLTAESLFGNASPQLGPFNVPYANFPTAASVPGCVPAATTCTFNNSAIGGVILAGGNGNLRPQKGKAWSIGVDFTPRFAPGLRLSATYWHNELRGGITAPQPALALGAADLSSLLQIFPTGATPAQVAAATQGLPQTSPLPATVYFIYNFQQNNVLNLDASGFDLEALYRFNTGFGRFTIAANATIKTQFDQFFGATGQVFSVLGTAGFNTTFPSVRLESRFHLGWEYGGLNTNIFVNHTGGYHNWSGTTQTPITRTNGFPTGGGDQVKSNTTVDLNLAYTFHNAAFLSQAQLFLDVTNLFDRDPPYYNAFGVNGASGYDGINASPLGRIVTIGLRANF